MGNSVEYQNVEPCKTVCMMMIMGGVILSTSAIIAQLI
jgi:hypothetical protein